MPPPSPRRRRETVYLTPLFRWLHRPLGRSWVQALVFIMAFQGLPLGQLRWQGPGGALLDKLATLSGLIMPSAHSATPVFGPEDFLRSKGKPVTIARTFFVTDPSGTFTLCIDNGGQNDEYGVVSSAEVHLNGVEVASPSDFNQGVAEVITLVSVAPNNELSIQLRSDPDSGFTL